MKTCTSTGHKYLMSEAEAKARTCVEMLCKHAETVIEDVHTL